MQPEEREGGREGGGEGRRATRPLLLKITQRNSSLPTRILSGVVSLKFVHQANSNLAGVFPFCLIPFGIVPFHLTKSENVLFG